MNCPACADRMRVELYEMAVLQRCPSCDEVWLDEQALEAILARREKRFDLELIWDTLRRSGRVEVPDDKAQRKLNCPTCGSRAEAQIFGDDSSIVMYVCPEEHGLALDSGELERIQVFEEYLVEYAEGRETE